MYVYMYRLTHVHIIRDLLVPFKCASSGVPTRWFLPVAAPSPHDLAWRTWRKPVRRQSDRRHLVQCSTKALQCTHRIPRETIHDWTFLHFWLSLVDPSEGSGSRIHREPCRSFCCVTSPAIDPVALAAAWKVTLAFETFLKTIHFSVGGTFPQQNPYFGKPQKDSRFPHNVPHKDSGVPHIIATPRWVLDKLSTFHRAFKRLGQLSIEASGEICCRGDNAMRGFSVSQLTTGMISWS